MYSEYALALHRLKQAQLRFKEAKGQAEIDAAIYALLEAETLFSEAHRKANNKQEGVTLNAGSERVLSQRSVGAS